MTGPRPSAWIAREGEAVSRAIFRKGPLQEGIRPIHGSLPIAFRRSLKTAIE